MLLRFANRRDAGKQLADALLKYRGKDVVVYALPRGGVALGFEVAQALDAPLDLVITRKIGHPMNPEYAVCAVTEEGDLLCDEKEKVLLDQEWLQKMTLQERQEALRRRKTYMPSIEHIQSKGKIAIVVDDGVATGLTIRVALQSIRKEKPRMLIVAIPVAPYEVAETLRKEADEVVVLEDTKDYLGAVGAYYEDFPQMSDDEVINLLAQSRR